MQSFESVVVTLANQRAAEVLREYAEEIREKKLKGKITWAKVAAQYRLLANALDGEDPYETE